MMIEINLLPQELKPSKAGVSFEPKLLLFALPVILAGLIIAHFYFAAQAVGINKKYSQLNKQWKESAGQREALKIEKDKSGLSSGAMSFAQAAKTRIAWSEKLSLLSENLPQGAWLNELAVNEKNFTLKGSVVSLDKLEVSVINEFLNKLKQDKAFIKDFVSLDLGPAQREKVGMTEKVDFTFSGQLK